MVTRIIRALHVSILVGGLTIAPVAHALKVQVNRKMMIRTANGERLDHAGYVEAGTVVEIPDKYAIVDSSGKVDTELTLNHWLKEAGYEQQDIDGVGSNERNDFFFPVKVNGAIRYMSLRVLAREQGALVVQRFADIYDGSSDDTPLRSDEREIAPLDEPEAAPATPPPASDSTRRSTTLIRPSSRMQEVAPREQYSAPTAPPAPPQVERSEAAPPCTDCGTGPASGGAISSLRSMVGPALQRAAQQYESNRVRTSKIDTIASTFRQTCGLSLNAFMPEIGRAAQRHRIPPSMMLSLMSQESMGDCFPSGQYKGLFQIGLNSKSRNVPVCTAAQKAQLARAGSVSALRSGPQCLENPVVNADEAARILRQKLDYLMDRMPKQDFVRADGKNNGFSAAAWRLAAAAYNGGEAYVLNAYNSMKEFNRKHGTNYTPRNWEDMKVFMFRSYLDGNKQREQYGTVASDRAWTRTALNIGYAENIIPTVAGRPGHETSLEAWSRYIRNNPIGQ